MMCGQKLERDDITNGLGPWLMHIECSLRMTFGGIGHLTNHDHWCHEEHDPDAGFDPRTSARMVQTWLQDNGVEKAINQLKEMR